MIHANVGDTIDLTYTFAFPDGSVITECLLDICAPDGKLYQCALSGGQVTLTSPATVSRKMAVTEAGQWWYRFTGSTATYTKSSGDKYIEVDPSRNPLVGGFPLPDIPDAHGLPILVNGSFATSIVTTAPGMTGTVVNGVATLAALTVVNGTPVTSVNFSDSFVPTYSGGTSLIERRDEIIFRPTLGLDDWGDLVPIWTAEYLPGGKRRKIKLAPGNYKAGTNGLMPPGLQVECMPGVDIECAYTPRVGPVAPYIGPFVADFNYTGFTATLTANAVIGSRTLLLTAKPAIGDQLILWRNGVGYPSEPFQVIKAMGSSSPYTIEVDHELTYAWQMATTAAATLIPNKDIYLAFNGATIHGPTERLLSIAAARDCVIRGYDCEASGCTEFPLSIDTCSMRSRFYKGFVRNSVGPAGYLESGYKNQIIDCHAVDCVQGFGAWGVNQRIRRCTATGKSKLTDDVTFAFVLGHPGANQDDGQTNGCRVEQCEGSGFRWGTVVYGTKDCVIKDSNFNDVDQGINTITTGTPDFKKAVNLRLENVKINGTVRHGIYNEAGHDMVLVNCEVRNSTMVACYNFTGSTMKIVGGYYQATTADRAIENDGGTIWISDWTTVDGATRAPLGTYLVVNNSANVYIESMRWIGVPVDSGGNFTIVAIGPRTVTGMVERVSGLASYFAAKSGGTSKWHRKHPVNMDGIGTLFSGTGQSTFGTVTLTGTTPVAIPWMDWKAGNQLFHSRSTLVGAPGDITYTSTPGVGVSIVSSTAETSVVNWRID